MHLKDLKKKTPAELVAMAEEMGIEGASTMRKQDLMFSILKVRAESGAEIIGMGTIEVLERRLRLPAHRPKPIISPVPTTSMSRPTSSAASACAPATPSKAKSAAPRTASAISR